MGDPKRVDASGSGLSGVASILDLLGGQKSTSTTSSDTSALSGILGQLQGTNYADVLKSIFTQAGGQIPGLQGAFANSVGARTGGNSAVQTALSKLLESTAIKGAAQSAQLQQQNQQMQIQAAGGIANGNKSTTQTSGVNTGKAAQNLALLQLGSKLYNSDTGKQLVGKAKDMLGFGADTANTGGAALDSAGPVLDFSGGSADFGAGTSFGSDAYDFSGAGDLFASSAADAFNSGAADSAVGAISDQFGDFTGDFGDFFADGGLVGRDGKKMPMVNMDADNDNSANDNPSDPNWEMDEGTYPKSAPTKQPSNQAGSPQSYADGGVVRAGGGRRSSAPTFDLQTPMKNNAVQSPRDSLNPMRQSPSGSILQLPPMDSGEANGMSSQSIDSIDSAQSAAVGNAIGNAVGHATMSAVVGPIGMAVANALGINTPQSAISQAVAAISQALGISTNNVGVATNNSGLTPQAMEAIAAEGGGSASNAGDANSSSTGSGADAAGGVGGSGAGEGGIGSTAGSGNNGGDNGADSGDSGGDSGYKDGGVMQGKGTGTSDSIKANVSKGEYIIPADVVQQLGVRFFDELRTHFHTPAEVQNGK